MNIYDHPSPNWGPRRDELLPTFVIIHYTAMDTAELALERLCSPEHEVSTHYLITARGKVYQLVNEDHRAWHAGPGSWGGVDDINSRSIGIELANDGTAPFAAACMTSLEQLLKAILSRWRIARSGVLGHSDIAYTRKLDPGERFDWRRLAMSGHAIWPSHLPTDCSAETDQFVDAAVRFGYSHPGQSARDFDCLLRAFRARFRPGVRGKLGKQDVAIIESLASRFPSGQET